MSTAPQSLVGARVLLVSGTRTMINDDQIRHVFDTFKPTSIIHGGARGADALAHRIAIDLGIPRAVYPADWDRLGKSAGNERNGVMVDEAAKLRDAGARVIVACFPGPTSRGTWDLYRKALAADLPVMVWRVRPSDCGGDR